MFTNLFTSSWFTTLPVCLQAERGSNRLITPKNDSGQPGRWCTCSLLPTYFPFHLSSKKQASGAQLVKLVKPGSQISCLEQQHLKLHQKNKEKGNFYTHSRRQKRHHNKHILSGDEAKDRYLEDSINVVRNCTFPHFILITTFWQSAENYF